VGWLFFLFKVVFNFYGEWKHFIPVFPNLKCSHIFSQNQSSPPSPLCQLHENHAIRIQNYSLFRLCSSSGILKTDEHSGSETESVSNRIEIVLMIVYKSGIQTFFATHRYNFLYLSKLLKLHTVYNLHIKWSK
jgi:hypothetical protein